MTMRDPQLTATEPTPQGEQMLIPGVRPTDHHARSAHPPDGRADVSARGAKAARYRPLR
ncbi:hypothetical protein NKG95_31200 [Mesorhizobium sp. M1423]|uniref:hypothetical protein n=1 Tax=Mesorhizobium sp. M1423 TaxID=2957101 RepID=UPI00333B52F1